MIAKILEYRSDNPESSLVADRLLGMIDTIARDFAGAERERLLAMVRETFENLVEIKKNAEQTRAALVRLENIQRQLTGLVNILLMKPTTDLIH